MNKIHRTVWNIALGAFVAAPETARAKGKTSRACGAALATLLLAGAAQAQSTINTVDTGWYTNSGTHSVGNRNYITGNFAGSTYRSYFVFDLGAGALAPNQIFSSATLNVNTAGVTGLPANGAAFQTVIYAGNVSALGTTSTSTATYAGLGDGTPAGSTEVSSATPGGSTLSVPINAAGLNALTAAAGQLFAFGGSLTGIGGSTAFVGGSSGGQQSLNYTVTTLGVGTYYWDLDGGSAGAGGASPSGIWGRTNAERFWNANSSGVGPTVAWIDGSTANFAAGSDATGDFTVTLGDNVTVNGIGYQGSNGSRLRIDAGTGFGVTTTAGNNGFDVANAGARLEVAAGVSGPGAVVKEGLGTLVMSGNNTYTGGTTVQAGTLAAGSAGGFVQNTAYVVNGGTLDLGLWDLATSGFSGTGGTVALNAQTLTANQATDSSYAGAITGAGRVVKAGAGTLTLSGASSFSGGTALKQGRINVGSNTALGTGELAMDDGTALGFSADGLTLANAIRLTGSNDPVIDTGSFSGTLAGAISGGGFLTKQGSGTLTLSASNTYTGATNVAQGTLRAGAANAFSPASAHNVSAGATLSTGGFNQAVGSLTNAGTVSLLGTAAGSTLTVNGNYVGNNGLLRVGTVLGDSTSATDKLVVTGNASGTTAVEVTNLGGLGGQTTGNGIQVVSAAGGISGSAFSLAAPVSAGAYDYRLDRIGTGVYLSNTLPAAPAAPVTPTYRADVPLYAALPEQLRQSNLAMLGNLHQRVGDDGGTGSNSRSAEQGDRQAWGRVISIDRDIQQSGTVSPSSSGRLTGFQAGTDLWANANWRAGVYVGQLEGDMSVNGFARGVVNYAAGSNDLRSQYLGAYATWKNDSGLYVDGVLQAGRHRYTVSPTLAFSGSGKGDSLLASIEVGQAFAIAPNWTIEPQLQLVHQRLSLDDTAITGAWVQQNTDGGWMARAGVRIKGEFQTGMGTLQPYARVNVYKRGSGTDTTTFIGPAAATPILTRTGGTSSELALGATWQLSPATSLYGELGKLWASGGDARTRSGVNGSLGVKVRW